MISGIAALVLSANPELTYRDVQQVMLLAASQTDSADPDLALASLGRIEDVEADWLLPGHGAPWREGVGAAVTAARANGIVHLARPKLA